MNYRIGWFLFFLLTISFVQAAYGQQDVDFHLNAHLLTGKKILKVKRDYNGPYLWVLAQNNKVYRINSLTLAIDDFTSTFSAYSSLPFIDIAGRSKDTVFVATNSNNLLEYKKGTLKVITQANGMTGTINQIGMDLNNQNFAYGGYHSGNSDNGLMLLLIATTTNIYYYDYVNEAIISAIVEPGNNRLFETTYRTQMYSNLGFGGYYDPVKQYPVDNHTVNIVYVGALFYNTPEFGNTINTAYYVTNGFAPYAYDYDDVDYMSQIWGTEKGLFQNNWDRSYYLTSVSQHYLDGIKVNKVTSIFGLLSFGGPMIKENLLVGTDKGLYFSSSGYGKYTPGPTFNYNTFIHDDEIGNKVINDICVDATSYATTLCEDGAWVAANDGLYLLRPDYLNYVSSQTVNVAHFNNQSDTTKEKKICAGDSVKVFVDTYIYRGNDVQWYKDGAELPAQSKDTLTIETTGDYYAVLYDPCSGIHLNSNHLKVDVITAPVFSFNYPDKIQQCGNAPTPLQTDNNPLYHYRWYTNGALNGDTTASYQVTQTGKYKVEVSACTNSWVPSKEVEVDLITLPLPQITTDKPVYCAGNVASLSVNVPADNSYTINWYRDNVLLPADNNLTTIQDTTAGSYTVSLNSIGIVCSQTSSPQQLAFTPAPYFAKDLPDEYRSCETSVPITITSPPSPNTIFSYRWYTNGVLNGSTGDSFTADKSGKYRVEMSSCAGSWVSSHEVQIDLVNLPTPTVSADKPVYCVGDNATLSVNVPADASYTINWYRDGQLLTANINKTSVITNVAGSYTASVINNLQNTDGTTCLQTSTAQVLTFNPPATVTIAEIVKTTICDGQVINLLAHYTGGTLKWSTGETTDQINVTTAGKYTATVTTAAGCTEDTSISVSFLPNPVFSVKDTSVCPYKGQPITLIAPEGFVKYAWNGILGGPTYQVTQPQTVQLTVTDINGCQTTLPIKVADHCPDIWIPNTFTPNSDGINDTWVIEGLDGDPTVLVSVYTRWGTLVFKSIGYGTPWNGQYQGKKLPAGVYYYLVKAKNGGQKFSGPLTIIY